jgi:hypothetical protein
MKINRIIIAILFALLYVSCIKEDRFASKISGVWNVDKAEKYTYDPLTFQWVLSTSSNNAGTITLTDEGKNKERLSARPYTNPAVIELGGGITGFNGDYYWSVDVTMKKDKKRIEFMWEDINTGVYYYTTWSIEQEDKNSMTWYYYHETDSGMDNGTDYKLILYLTKT